MQISDERVADFISCWKAAFDEDLVPSDAVTLATQLLELARRLHRPLPPEGGALLEELRAHQAEHQAP